MEPTSWLDMTLEEAERVSRSLYDRPLRELPRWLRWAKPLARWQYNRDRSKRMSLQQHLVDNASTARGEGTARRESTFELYVGGSHEVWEEVFRVAGEDDLVERLEAVRQPAVTRTAPGP